MDLADVRSLFDYTEWANGLAMDAAAKLPQDDLHRDFGVSHRSIFETLLHTAGAEWIWLERWCGRSPRKDEAWSLWKTDSCPDLGTLRKRWGEVVERRADHVGQLKEADLRVDHHFDLLNGDTSSMRLSHQMQHVVNHSTMHRGQIVGMIRQLGLEPPATDLIFYIRREISPKWIASGATAPSHSS